MSCIVSCILANTMTAAASKRGVIVGIEPKYPIAGWEREIFSRLNVEWKMDDNDLLLMKKDSEEMGERHVLYREYMEGEDTEEVIDTGATIFSKEFRPFLRKKPDSSWFSGVEISVFDVAKKQKVGRVYLGDKDYIVMARYWRQREQMQKGDMLGKGYAEVKPRVNLRRHMKLRPNIIYRVCMNVKRDFYDNLINATQDEVAFDSRCGYFKILRADDREKRSQLLERVGRWQIENRNSEEAITLLSRALKNNPKNYMASSRLAVLFEGKGRRKRDLAYLERARKIYKSMSQIGKKGGLCWKWMRCVDIEREMIREEKELEKKIRVIKDKNIKCRLRYSLSIWHLVGGGQKRVFFHPWEKFAARIFVGWYSVDGWRKCGVTLKQGRGWFDHCELVVVSRDSGKEVYRSGLDVYVKRGLPGSLRENDRFAGLVTATLDGVGPGRYLVRLRCKKKKTLKSMTIEAKEGFGGLTIEDGGGKQEFEIIDAKDEEEKLLEVFHRAWWSGMWTDEAEKVLSDYLAEHGDNRDLLSLLLRLNLEKGDFDEAEEYRARLHRAGFGSKEIPIFEDY